MVQQSWEVLRDRAEDYNRSARVLARDGLWQNALEAAYLSLEIAMKAAVGKAGNKYPDSARKGHD